ncbi:hypothetical protein QFC19_000601 [Naganishia cerealis]|uniref:Uncharacterized protein n=1 Tax=Naganishia cerealis TaxID=610337 RepID=A0ACC2WLR7_9TREE|nr:hypothetical protein QFC19_000601 [Naganishia cerealis]
MSTTLEALKRIECTTAHQVGASAIFIKCCCDPDSTTHWSSSLALSDIPALINIASPLGPTFIPALDKYLANARANTFTRETSEEQRATEVFEDQNTTSSSLNHGDFYEIQGTSGSGKTQLVLFLLMTSILPAKIKFRESDLSDAAGKDSDGVSTAKQIRELGIGGKAQSVIFIHSSTHASPILRLSSLITSHVEHCLSSSEQQISAESQAKLARLVVKSALSRLTVFKIPIANASFAASDIVSPYAPLAATLAFIPQHVRQSDCELSLLIIDGIGDGFWQTRWQREQRSKEIQLRDSNNPQSQQQRIRSSQDVTMDDVVKRIDYIRRELGCAVIVTNQAIWKPTNSEKNQAISSTHFWAQHLPPPFPSPFETVKNQHAFGTHGSVQHNPNNYWPLTAQITLLPLSTNMRQMRPDILLYDVLRKGGEGDKREQARLNAKLRGLVRLPGQTNARQAGEFAFTVGEGEVETT